MPEQMSAQQFAARIREKHPGAYDDVPDAELTQKVLAKYPEYGDMVSSAPAAPAPVAQPDNSIWEGVKAFGREINPVTALTGLRDAAAHPIDTLDTAGQNMVKRWKAGYQQIKSGDVAGGSANMLYGSVPFVGEAIAQKGDQFSQGQYAKAVGGSLGLGTNLAAPGVVNALKPAIVGAASKVGAAGQDFAQGLYKSALKPPTTTGAAKVAGMVDAGLENGIPVSSAGVSKISAAIMDLNEQITKKIQARPGEQINKFAVASRLTDTADRLRSQVNPTHDLAKVADVGNEFIGTNPASIPAETAQNMKVGTYQQLQANYGKMSNATVEAQKSLARGLKEELANAFPELNELNAAEGKLLDLQPALERAVQRNSNHQILGIGTPIAGTAATAMSGSLKAGAVVATMKAVLDNPLVKSKLATAIYQASKKSGGVLTQAGAAARVQGYINALGNSVGGDSGTATGQTAE